MENAKQDTLDTVSPEAVRLVLQVVGRMTSDVVLDERFLAEMQAGGGRGLLAADAMSRAVARVGAWTVVDHLEAFFKRFANGQLATPELKWAFDRIAGIRSGAFDITNPDENIGGKALDASNAEVHSRLGADSVTWLETCVLRLAGFAGQAAWSTRPDAWRPAWNLEGCADSVGVRIAYELGSECSASAVQEFILSLRSLGTQDGERRAA
jgi:hypothetical protein